MFYFGLSCNGNPENRYKNLQGKLLISWIQYVSRVSTELLTLLIKHLNLMPICHSILGSLTKGIDRMIHKFGIDFNLISVHAALYKLAHRVNTEGDISVEVSEAKILLSLTTTILLSSFTLYLK